MTTFGIHLHLVMMAGAFTMLVLLGLTMRSVIMREKAMIRERRQDHEARQAYETRWRNLGAQPPAVRGAKSA